MCLKPLSLWGSISKTRRRSSLGNTKKKLRVTIPQLRVRFTPRSRVTQPQADTSIRCLASKIFNTFFFQTSPNYRCSFVLFFFHFPFITRSPLHFGCPSYGRGPRARHNLSLVLIALGQAKEAKEELRKAAGGKQ